MFDIELYFDDSGTDGGTPVAVAACYVAHKTQWDEFVKNWDRVMADEGFDMFHMAEFVAKPEMGHEPFCRWDKSKKDRVYAKLASIINTRTRTGFAIAVPKKPFDEYVFDEFREYAQNHYVFCVKSVMGIIDTWRQKYKITQPMQYVFESGTVGQKQIAEVWDDRLRHEGAEEKYGFAPDGVLFENKRLFKPLQAADILAWQMQNQMRRTVLLGHKSETSIHPGFKVLRANRTMELGFYSREQMKQVMVNSKEFHDKHGVWPWEPEARQYSKITLGPAGEV